MAKDKEEPKQDEETEKPDPKLESRYFERCGNDDGRFSSR